MQFRPVQSAPNYTNAALGFGLVNLLWIFGVIWVLYGLTAVILMGTALNHAITRLAVIRAEKDR